MTQIAGNKQRIIDFILTLPGDELVATIYELPVASIKRVIEHDFPTLTPDKKRALYEAVIANIQRFNDTRPTLDSITFYAQEAFINSEAYDSDF